MNIKTFIECINTSIEQERLRLDIQYPKSFLVLRVVKEADSKFPAYKTFKYYLNVILSNREVKELYYLEYKDRATSISEETVLESKADCTFCSNIITVIVNSFNDLVYETSKIQQLPSRD